MIKEWRESALVVERQRAQEHLLAGLERSRETGLQHECIMHLSRYPMVMGIAAALDLKGSAATYYDAATWSLCLDISLPDEGGEPYANIIIRFTNEHYEQAYHPFESAGE